MKLVWRRDDKSKDPNYWLSLGEEKLRENDTLEAAKAFVRLIGLNPLNNHSWIKLEMAIFKGDNLSKSLRKSLQKDKRIRKILCTSAQMAHLQFFSGAPWATRNYFELFLSEDEKCMKKLDEIGKKIVAVAVDDAMIRLQQILDRL